MYGTVTHLHFRDESARAAAVKGLEVLVSQARRSLAFVDCYVLEVGNAEAAMVTLYVSEEKAEELSGSTRVHIGETIGPYVSGRPERFAGKVVIGGSD